MTWILMVATFTVALFFEVRMWRAVVRLAASPLKAEHRRMKDH